MAWPYDFTLLGESRKIIYNTSLQKLQTPNLDSKFSFAESQFNAEPH